MALFEPKFYYPEGKEAFQQRVPWTDEECILLSLENSINLAGLDKNQVERIIKERMAPPKVFPNRLMKS